MSRPGFRPGKRSLAMGRANFRPGELRLSSFTIQRSLMFTGKRSADLLNKCNVDVLQERMAVMNELYAQLEVRRVER